MQTTRSTSPLVLRLLGDVQLTLDGQPIACGSRKALALFIYLVLVPRRHRRTDVAALLWGTRDPEAARTSLRTALQRLPAALSRALDAQRETIGLAQGAQVEVDAGRFESLAASEDLNDLEQGSQLYAGELLKGLDADGAPGFEDWLMAERARLAQLAQDVFDRLIAGHRDVALRNAAVSAAARANAMAAARRWLQVEPAAEAAHRWLMQLLIDAGQREAARLQYEVCRRALAVSHGRAPSQQTRALYDQLAQFEARTTPLEPELAFPVPSTSFVGRLDELASLQRLLSDPRCRLLSLHGLGGIGKSRLAAALLAQAAPLYRHGVAWVSAEHVPSAARLPQAIAAACTVELRAAGDLVDALCGALRLQHRLLALDGFDLLARDDAAVDLLLRLLRAAPHLQVVLTTRQVLGVQEEWVYDVPGLSVPSDDDTQPSSEYAAVELFMQRARQAYLGFSLTAEWHHVVRLCQFTGGLPLGLELAAAWLRSMPCGDLVRAFEAALPSAPLRQRNRLERHESLSAIVRTSWELLGADEQRALAALTVFAGGFTLHAAQGVAESPLRVISVLIDKALVARSSSGRLDLHPVVRAFCAGELAKDEAARRTALRMHAAHFAELLERCRARYDGPDEVGAQAELLAELSNIFQAAEQWLADAELIERTSEPLCRLLSGAGRPRDLRAMAERMLASQIRAATAARVLTLCGMAAATMHDPAGARDAFQRALAVADSRALRLHVQVQAVIADLGSDRIAEADEQLRECEAQLRPDDSPLLWIRLRSLQGAVAHARAKPTLALERQTEALRLAQSVQAPLLVATIQSSIGLTLALSGQLDAAEQALRGCLETLKSAGRPEVMRSLNALAFVLMKKGEAAEAASLARQAIDLVERNGGHPAALFSGLIDTLGRALWSLGQRDEARQQFERASSFGGPISEAEARSNLALLDIEVGRHDEAVRSIEKLLQSANEHDLVFARSHALVSGAALAAAKATSKSTAARWLLTVIGQHDLPADEQERASKLLVDLTPVAPEAVAAPSLNEALRELTAYLARLRER